MATTTIIAIVGAILPAATSVIAWLTARYVKQRWLRELINAITSNAVSRIEKEIVQPLKTNPNVETPDGKLTPEQAAYAKQKAIDIASDNLRMAGHEIAPHVVGAAIERAVAAMKAGNGKAKNLPDIVKNILPCLLAFIAVAGCASLPNGWSSADVNRIERATIIAMKLFAENVELNTQEHVCVVYAGTIAAMHYKALEALSLDKGVRAARSIAMADCAARKAFPKLFAGNRSLSDIILSVLNIQNGTTSDAEAMLALLRAALIRYG